MIKWEWEILKPDDPRFQTCGEPRTKSGKVRCEYPPNHLYNHHFGRGRSGRWYSWPNKKENTDE